MLDTIVVGVDGREGGRDALALAGFFQRAFGSEIAAVHAYPHDPLPSRATNPAFDTAMQGDAAQTVLNEVQATASRARAVTVPDSSPARALHRVAERDHAALIVVGSDHRGPLGRVLAGDVTSGVLYGAPCPVAVAPRGMAPDAPAPRTVGVGYDGSPEAREALELAHELAQTNGATLEVVCVLLPPLPLGPYALTVLSTDDRWQTERERVEAILAEACAQLGNGARTRTIEGVADIELAAHSHALDLLVVGSRGYGPLKRLMMGSTSAKLVRSAQCPVIVVPRGAREVQPELASLAGAERA